MIKAKSTKDLGGASFTAMVPEHARQSDLVPKPRNQEADQEFYSIAELASRWRCSRGTVYNRLRAEGARVLDFAQPGKRCKKVISAKTVLQIETRKTKRLA